MQAPPGRALRTVTAARVASGSADALILGTGLPGRSARPKIAGFALGWAALDAIALWRAAR